MVGKKRARVTRSWTGDSSVWRVCVGRLTAAGATFALMFALGGSSAYAATVHPFLSSFGGGETPGGQISPFGVAIDNSASVSAGDVYVTDFTSRALVKFDESGIYLPPPLTGQGSSVFSGFFATQNAVDASGNVFVGDTGGNVVDEFGPAGEDLKLTIELGEGPTAVAVDSSGRVLIATSKAVYRYDLGTASLSQLATAAAGEEFAEVNGVAVDNDPSSPSFGDVYVVDSGKGVVDVFDASGSYQSQLTGTPSGAFGFVYRDVVDPTTGHLYVTTETTIDEFTPTGVFVSQTSVPNGGFPTGVAISAKTGTLYVTDLAQGVVDVFGPAVQIPDVNGIEATNAEPTGITVHGHVDPAGGGEVVTCTFEYGTDTSYGTSTPCNPAPPYSSPTDVSATLTGLTPDTSYHFRIAAGNAVGTGNSEDGIFETTGPPTIAEQAAVAITRNMATLQAQINPHGLETTYQVEYGETEAYGNTLPASPATAGSGLIPETVAQVATNLKVGTGYHFRFVATSAAGVVDGPDSTFSTLPPAVVENVSWVAGPHEATLKARIEDFGVQSACEVEYVTEAEFNSGGYSSPTIVGCTPTQLAGSEGELHALARPSGLAAGTTYHFRFLLSNEYGEQRSSDQLFTTFGIAAFAFEDLDHEGHLYTQAGGHPAELVTKVDLGTTTDLIGNEAPTGTLRDVSVHLPAGLIGNPQATAKCTRYASEQQECSGASQVGLIEVQVTGEQIGVEPLFNIVPPRGVAAELGARFNKFASGFIDTSVRTGSDYGINADSLNITTLVPVKGVRVTIWGVPADPSHDAQRSCPEEGGISGYHTNCPVSIPLRPFLTNPTACSGAPLTASVLADTYQASGEFASRSAEMPPMTGCERLHFRPTMSVQPEASAADSPTGLHVDLHIPQEENASGLAEAELKNTTVSLPRGVVINPAGAGGLTACSEAQIELHGPKAAACPDSSKVGSVELVSPLVDHPLHGAVYVAQQGNGGPAQGSNPFGSLIALYIAINDPQAGVVVKQSGKVVLDADTGRLTATFSEIPQLPFEDLKIDFFAGPRAALITPLACGSYAASASLVSWAEESSALGVSPAVKSFEITSGPSGSPCPSGGFAPAFTAGAQSSQAGAFSPFTLAFSRQDGEQRIAGLEATLSPGLLAKLAGVPLCGAAEAVAGACPSASQIGTVTATAGAGQDPIAVQGQVYLTGPYNGGPFGEVVEVPAIAGPFNLGTVAVRGSIRINPFTAQATVVSDPFPTMLQGVPLTLKRVAVTLDRSGFTFNPTNCDQFALTGKITATTGASAPVSVPFQVVNCAKLPFKPRFTVSTQAKSSKAGGASLRVKITSGAGQANLGKVKVALPKQLPSRLSTLQKACPAAVFEANPAACPAGSTVGFARAVTPILKAPFVGPAYLVSHGGAAFPDLEIVLQSEGITIIQDGKTNIKKGVTTSTFNTIPDAPITTFELTLPEGPHSALSAFLPAEAKHSMCGQKLLMPTQIIGQNGAVIKQTTKLSVTGCQRKHKVHKAKRR